MKPLLTFATRDIHWENHRGGKSGWMAGCGQATTQCVAKGVNRMDGVAASVCFRLTSDDGALGAAVAVMQFQTKPYARRLRCHRRLPWIHISTSATPTPANTNRTAPIKKYVRRTRRGGFQMLIGGSGGSHAKQDINSKMIPGTTANIAQSIVTSACPPTSSQSRGHCT